MDVLDKGGERLGRSARSGAHHPRAAGPFVLLLAGIASLTLLLAPSPAAQGSPAKPAWQRAPVLPEIGGKLKSRLLRDIERGRRLKVRPRVFAKVGDSNTEAVDNLYGLGCRKAKLAGRTGLAKTIARYRRVRVENERPMDDCRPWNSFSRRSAAVKSASIIQWQVWQISEIPDAWFWEPPSDCEPVETPLGCELDRLRPRYTIVMTGTNDVGMDIYFGHRPGYQVKRRLRPVIRAIRAAGSVPVISTIPPMPGDPATWDGAKTTNRGIWQLARQMRVPMINLWRALTAPGVINFGLSDKEVHLSVFRGNGEYVSLTPGPTTYEDSVNFTPRALRFGANRRNLIWLQTLHRLDRAIGVR